MKVDLYTRTVLTLLLIVLAALTVRVYSLPISSASAQTPSYVPLPYDAWGFVLLDTRSGRVWQYYWHDSTVIEKRGKAELRGVLVELGKPLGK